ncbi:unnamed protein product [Ceutorhynchus assimilis]|uniref:Beta-glucosidase n=1 Tax=Ceutorhynchus assimilis TaxID=467358 RepID=A0A9N9MIT6_9CUCU|nr:unnamed protein product [Ceutorhynchus assimilis]
MHFKVILIFSLLEWVLAARKIPDNLLFGAATAAYQIEGAWNEDGKGESMWDRFEHDRGGENGDITCDSYHKWQEDVANAKQLGLNFYRFSIAWTRILPNGTLNSINQKGIDYYLNLIKALKDAGIEPMVTIYHWDMPQHLNELGGFLNPQFADYFGDFARLVYQLYGSYVKYWITINEPLSICLGGYGSGQTAPGLKLDGDGNYQCAYVLLKAHAKAYRIYDEEFKSKYNGEVGISLNTNWFEPAKEDSKEDSLACERILQFMFGWFANPISNGNWPQVMIDRIANRSALEGLARSRLPEFTQEEIEYIKGTYDFIGFNTYKVYKAENIDYPIGNPSYNYDSGVSYDTDVFYFYPEGFRKLINFINHNYNPSSIIVTENGLQTGDSLEDQDRIEYLTGYIDNLLDAIELDGINVVGYTVWSIMDNFEWGTYANRFGLIRTDFEDANRTRTWKASAKWYQNLIATRELKNDTQNTK